MLKFVEYLFLEFFFLFFFDKSVPDLLLRRYLMSKFPEILILVCRKIFSVFTRFEVKLFPIPVVSLFIRRISTRRNERRFRREIATKIISSRKYI